MSRTKLQQTAPIAKPKTTRKPKWYEANPDMAMCVCIHSRAKWHPGDGACTGHTLYDDRLEPRGCQRFTKYQDPVREPSHDELVITPSVDHQRWMVSFTLGSHYYEYSTPFLDTCTPDRVIRYLRRKAAGPLQIRVDLKPIGIRH